MARFKSPFALLALTLACGGTQLSTDDCDYREGESCYDTMSAACEAAGCSLEDCLALETYPAQVQCSSGNAAILDATTDQAEDDAVQAAEECGATYDGQCYEAAEQACEAAGCALDVCQQMESYPVQVACPE